MTIINYSTSFNALDNYVKTYNEKTTFLAEQIRQAIVLTAQNLIKIYALTLIKANNISTLDLDNLPPLRTNNAQLARMCNASTRTIQRHIKRLQEAGFITNKIWHGSNSSYELFINQQILLVNNKKPVNKKKTPPLEQNSLTTQNQSFKKNNTTNCLHTDSSNNSYKTNILIEVDKLSKKMSSLPLTAKSESRNATSNKFSGYTEEKCPEKSKDAEGNAQKKRVTIEECDKKTLDNVALSASRIGFSEKLWNYAENTIYLEYHLTNFQKQSAKEHILNWYLPFESEKELNRIHQVYIDRIDLVRKYISKNPENRYVQLPNKYFDLNNPYGFKGTRNWYFKQKAQQEALRLKLILKAQIRKFQRNEDKPEHKRLPSLEIFRECETRLGKLGNPELLKAFHASVIQLDSYKYLN